MQLSGDSVNNGHDAADLALFQHPMGPHQPPLMIGQVLTVFGPVLPPVMQWKRTFEKVLPLIGISDIPKYVFQSDLGAFLNKQSSEPLFSAPAPTLLLFPAHDPSTNQMREVTPIKRPVAPALCFDDIDEPVSEAFVFSVVPQVSLKRGRKSKASRVIVDSEVRRSARLSALHDGYRKVTAGTPSKKPHTLKKHKTTTSQLNDNSAVPPLTAIVDLQRIGARLRIAPEKISTDKLAANPAKSNNSTSSDD